MRIISGIFKGRKIDYLKNHTTRPLKDSVKESIFNILIHSDAINVKLDRSNVLDLYSGVGSFGIECISRGAQKVTFIENYKEAIDVLKKNLQKLDCLEKSRIIERDCFDIFDSQKIFDEKFDRIFLDPPYKEKDLKNLLDSLLNYNILNTNGIIIIHRHVNQIDNFPKSFQIIEEKKYGISKIIFGSYFN